MILSVCLRQVHGCDLAAAIQAHPHPATGVSHRSNLLDLHRHLNVDSDIIFQHIDTNRFLHNDQDTKPGGLHGILYGSCGHYSNDYYLPACESFQCSAMESDSFNNAQQ